MNATDVPVDEFIKSIAREKADYNTLSAFFFNFVADALSEPEQDLFLIAPTPQNEQLLLESLSTGRLAGKQRKFLDERLASFSAEDRRRISHSIITVAKGKPSYGSSESGLIANSYRTVSRHYAEHWAPRPRSRSGRASEETFLPPYAGTSTDAARFAGGLRNLAWTLARSRVRNFQHLKELYGKKAQPSNSPAVALFTPSLVDFDYFLGAPFILNRQMRGHEPVASIQFERKMGQATVQASLQHRVAALAQIAAAFPGELHPFVPFCPWRQVDDEARKVAGDKTALGLVRDAILNRGFIGVKLYPPMGFRPMNNKGLDADARNDGPDTVFPPHFVKHSGPGKRFPYSRNFGSLLDSALSKLYDLCVEHDVPIMAHCAYSRPAWAVDLQGTTTSEFAAPLYWNEVLKESRWEKLRLNLSHFAHGRREWRWDIGILMDRYPNVYADLSYFEKFVNASDCVRQRKCYFGGAIAKGFFHSWPGLDDLTGIKAFWQYAEKVESYDTTQHAKLSICKPATQSDSWISGEGVGLSNDRWSRLMYGSDWSMLSQEEGHADYLNTLAASYGLAVDDDPSKIKAFLSLNAARFLGIVGPGAKPATRRRLERYYAGLGNDRDWIDRRFAAFDQLNVAIPAP